MSKTFHKLYTIQVKGSSPVAEDGIDNMLTSIQEALEGTYKDTRIETTVHDVRAHPGPILTAPWPVRSRKSKLKDEARHGGK